MTEISPVVGVASKVSLSVYTVRRLQQQEGRRSISSNRSPRDRGMRYGMYVFLMGNNLRREENSVR